LIQNLRAEATAKKHLIQIAKPTLAETNPNNRGFLKMQEAQTMCESRQQYLVFPGALHNMMCHAATCIKTGELC
jgi:hypothetical protein